MSENYIYAIEVGTEEVPIKLNHSLGTDTQGHDVTISSRSGFSIADRTGDGCDYFRVYPKTHDGDYLRMCTPNGGRISMDAGGNITVRHSDASGYRGFYVDDSVVEIENVYNYDGDERTTKLTMGDSGISLETPGNIYIESNYGHIGSMEDSSYPAYMEWNEHGDSRLSMYASNLQLKGKSYLSLSSDYTISMTVPTIMAKASSKIDFRLNDSDVHNRLCIYQYDKDYDYCLLGWGFSDCTWHGGVHATRYDTSSSDWKKSVVSMSMLNNTYDWSREVRCDLNGVQLQSQDDSDKWGTLRVEKSYIYHNVSFTTATAGLTELFEWEDGNPENEERLGKFITIEGNRISIATPLSDYILGVVDPLPYSIGDAPDEWPKKYLTDVYGRTLFEEIWVEPKLNESGEVLIEGKMIKVPAINPDYDESQEYIYRQDRPEYAAITSKGKVVMIDDGTCVPGKFATVGEGGIATHSDDNIAVRVLSRVDENHVRVYIDSVFMIKH